MLGVCVEKARCAPDRREPGSGWPRRLPRILPGLRLAGLQHDEEEEQEERSVPGSGLSAGLL